MKLIKLLALSVFLVLLFNACKDSEDPSVTVGAESFITTWETTTANESITVPTNSDFSYDYQVDWGDGSISTETGDATHTYATAGTYQVEIAGTFPAIRFGVLPESDTNLEKIKSIDQWGNQVWQSMQEAFQGCTQLTYTASDAPDLSQVTDMGSMFEKATSFNGAIGNWNVSNVMNMVQLFDSALVFNQDIGSWNVSSVTDMGAMFWNAQAFNQDIGNWNVSKVTDMRFMFSSANAFNQDIGNWNVSNVTDMLAMFSLTSAFNQDIGNWNVSNVTNMRFMFFSTDVFNQDIGNWNVSKVTSMGGMFSSASVFNQDIGNWNVSNVTNMRFMFESASAFNQDLSTWSVEQVTDCFGFNQLNSALSTGNLPNFTNCTF